MTAAPFTQSTRQPSISQRHSLIVLVLAVATVLFCWLVPAAKEGQTTGVVMKLPDRVGLLEGIPEAISQAELSILPPDTTFARESYGQPGAPGWDRFQCSIVLSGREKRSIHRPERCLPGQGWTVLNSQVVDIPLASGHPLQATALLLRRPLTTTTGQTITQRAYYLYWYVGRNVTTPYSFRRVLLTNWDLVFHRQNQRWAYVIYLKPIMQGLIPDGRSPEQTLGDLKDFIRQSAPFFMRSEMSAFDLSTADAGK